MLLSSPKAGVAVVILTKANEFHILKVFPFQSTILDFQIKMVQHNKCIYMPVKATRIVELNL